MKPEDIYIYKVHQLHWSPLDHIRASQAVARVRQALCSDGNAEVRKSAASLLAEGEAGSRQETALWRWINTFFNRIFRGYGGYGPLKQRMYSLVICSIAMEMAVYREVSYQKWA